MRKDRLRHDKDDIHNLDDIIDARTGHTSHLSQDTDSLEEDIEIPEDIDVDDALTFPHPKKKHKETDYIELMDTPTDKGVERNVDDMDIQPSDYESHYDDVIDTYATDDLDGVVEDKVHNLSHIMVDDVEEEPTVDVMPDKFTPKEDTME